MQPTGRFKFDGDVGSYLGINIVSFFLMLLTVFIATPWALCMRAKWNIHHTTIDGKRLKFTGTGGELFGKFFVWWLLTIVTLGIYSFWIGPNLQRWTVEHTDFE